MSRTGNVSPVLLSSPALSEKREASMSFCSILCPGERPPREEREPPECFYDLHLDQIVQGVVVGRDEYDLTPLFHARVDTVDTVHYRQQVMHDLEDPPIRHAMDAFAQHMRRMRHRLKLADKAHCRREGERWFLDAASCYIDAVESLARDLTELDPPSPGLRAWVGYLRQYLTSASYGALTTQARDLVAGLGAIRYDLHIRGHAVTVQPCSDAADGTAVVNNTFERFRRTSVEDYRRSYTDSSGMDSVQERVVDRVALLFPDVFAALERFCGEQSDYADAVITRFDREVQFYLAWLDYIDGCRQIDLAFCYPAVSDTDKTIDCRECFDLALARALAEDGHRVVCNDIRLAGDERSIVVSGPNQGGKTTFARAFGQMHYLAALGCKVPGTQARLFLCDALFTHFERTEDISDLRGKLGDDLARMHDIFSRASSSSIIILNEMFASTTLDDALWLSRQILQRTEAKDMLCVCVTFIDELAVFSRHVVSMVAAIDPDDPAVRTFRVQRRAADGLAYAQAIAEKYRVTAAWLQQRLTP